MLVRHPSYAFSERTSTSRLNRRRGTSNKQLQPSVRVLATLRLVIAISLIFHAERQRALMGAETGLVTSKLGCPTLVMHSSFRLRLRRGKAAPADRKQNLRSAGPPLRPARPSSRSRGAVPVLDAYTLLEADV